MSDQPQKIDSQSMDIEQADRNKLQSLFPQCFSEGKLDIDKLLNLCGEYIDESHEKYKFEWKGKAESYRHSGKRSNGTLRPAPAESVDFDTTQNLYIEGDNLEVLKLLQKSYYGKVKMIYIDPPYNTGNDFVYNDDFKEPLVHYKEVTSQVTKSNPESMGRFHTAWLNMMYPRLRLAHNLLKDDGVIFISLDDTEIHNLRKICDEVFGEENFVGSIGWESKTKSQNTITAFNKLQPKIEYILAYTKASLRRFNLFQKGEKQYPLSDENGQYREHILELMNADGIRGRETMVFDISDGVSTVSLPAGKQWQLGQDQVAMYRERGDLFVRENKVVLKLRKEDERNEITEPFWAFFNKEIGTAESAKKELSSLVDNHGFETVKPVELVRRLVHHATDKNDIILDFFSGSGTTAHSVIKLNAEDGGNRRFIMVQLPEMKEERSAFKTVCELGKERIRQAGTKIVSELTEGQIAPDTGFRVLKLDTSNLVSWDGTPIQSTDKELRQAELWDRISARDKTIKPDRTELDVVFEVMLKMGVDLNTSVTEITAGERKCYTIGEVLVCLDFGITADDVTAFCELQPKTIVVAEEAFADSTAMSNAHYILKDRDIEMKLL